MNRQIAVVVLLLSAIVGVLVVDDDATSDPVAATEIDRAAFPIASAADAGSSTWFCAGGTADEEAFADHIVTVFNPHAEAAVVTFTVFGGEVAAPVVDAAVAALDPDAADPAATEDDAAAGPSTPPVTRRVEIGPRRRFRVALSEYLSAPIASALVEAPVGGLVVEHEVSSIHGNDHKPCAAQASDTWHFAWGTTERAARELLVLFNPFPGDAIVDGRFTTEDGSREPVRFAGLVVPGQSTLAVDLGDDVTRRAAVSASLTTRTGRIVVDRVLRLNGSDGRGRGLTVQLGVPTPQRTWVFPDSVVAEGVIEEFAVYNPTDDVAEVEISFALDRPEENGIPEPVDLSLPPGGATTVDLAADGRLPLGVGHVAIVRSANDTPIVAERVVRASEGRKGVTVTTGSPVEAERWSLAAGAATGSTDEWVALFNLDPLVLAEVDLAIYVAGEIVEIPALQDLVVEAGERRVVRLGDHLQRDQLSLVVTSTEPIVVERGIGRSGADAIGRSAAVGIPLPGGLRVPGDPVDIEIDADLGDLDLEVEDFDDLPVAPDDVELPEPDETIVIDDPDAPVADAPTDTDDPDGAGEPGEPGESDSTTTAPVEEPTTTAGGVPDTVPAEGG